MFTEPHWIELLGGLRVHHGHRVITRFRTQKAGSLLAYLAFYRDRLHPREELIEWLWPNTDPSTGRMNLRSALASLRKQIEPLGLSRGSIIVSHGNEYVSLHPDAGVTDTAEFESALARAKNSASPDENVRSLARAVELYGGPLLPGRFDPWVLVERERLADRYRSALRQLGEQSARSGHTEITLDCVYRMLVDDPFDDELYNDATHLLKAAGQPESVLRKFSELERLLRELTDDGAPRKLPSGIGNLIKEIQRTLHARPQPGFDSQGAPAPAIPVHWKHTGTRDSGTPPMCLPFRLTRFFGRGEEITRICDRLLHGEERLLTITGTGGFGKTRLSIEVGYRLAESFDGAVYFVSLADLTDPSLIPHSIADTLKIEDRSEPMERMVEALSRQKSLLILDNFEQLIDGGAGLVWSLLERTPNLSCLITSRQPIGVSGESQIALSPMAVPPPSCAPEQLLNSESVQLFIDRAQAVRPDFQITPSSAPEIARLCRHLEGIPLSIELAASWAQTLTPSQILARLSHRFDLLISHKKEWDPRHQSLRGVIEASYELLSPGLRELFAGLSVFCGGGTLEAVEAVCGGEDRLSDVARLVERSFIYTEESFIGERSELRYQMLDTLREFAEERLAEREEAVFRHAHLSYFTRLAEQMDLEEKKPGYLAFWHRLTAERENFRCALGLAVEAGETELGLRLASALWQYWLDHGCVAEVRERMGKLLFLPNGAGKVLQAKAYYCAGYLAFQENDFPVARSHLEQSLAIYKETETLWGIAAALNQLGFVAMALGDLPAARHNYEQSLTFARGGDIEWDIAIALNGLGNTALIQGDHEEARACGEEARSLWKKLDQGWGIAWSNHLLGKVAWLTGDPHTARALLLESLRGWREVGHMRNAASVLLSLGSLSLEEGDLTEALAAYRESLSILVETSERKLDKQAVLLCLEGMAILLGSSGDLQGSAQLFGAVETLKEEIGTSLPDPLLINASGSSLKEVRTRLGERDFIIAWVRGLSLTWKQALALAIETTEVLTF